MARIGEKLSPIKVRKLKAPGMYGDGRGLWLHVGPSAQGSTDPLAAKSWIFRYQIAGKSHEMGLGAVHTVGLAEARKRAQAARHLCLDGVDPLDQKKGKKARDALEAAKAVTFKACAAQYIASNRAGWRNLKHARQWDTTLAAFVYPVIGHLPVGAIDTGHITKILEPIWASKSETASRVRGRIESVLDYAKSHGWREGVENPARWRGHLENVLPKRSRVAKVKHHAALPWREVNAFMAKLEGQGGVTALALKFAILTAARTGEVVGARWSEIDLQAALWTVPGERMKAAREHRVPLADGALTVLREAGKLRMREADGFVFPGSRNGKPLSPMAMLALLHRMGCGVTVHGFRSCFADWGAETGQPSDIVETALAHTLNNRVQAAYQRGDLLERRRRLMGQWAAFCGGPVVTIGGEVVALRAAAV